MTSADLTPELIDRVDAWIAEDPDPETVAELTDRLTAARTGDGDAVAGLIDAFNGTLTFGTAGLRGRIAAGPKRMNRVVVARAAAGLASYLREHGGESVVIGYDARKNSAVFARDTAEIMQAAGITALLLPQHLPTPTLAFAILHLGTDAGVMVTASHNPPDDNGYKVYLGDGSQIIPPADSEIAAHIAAVGPVNELPRSDDWTLLDDGVREAYLDRVVSRVAPDTGRDLRIVYTPMHGVGGLVQVEALERAGFDSPIRVAAQFDPDPAFPTVSFPNPEEPGAMDLAFATAVETAADLVIANDPDADRCAAAVPVPPTEHGDAWRRLTGDEVGALLGWWIVERARRAGVQPAGSFAASVVSGSLLERIARSAGLDFHRTLTGFKWISKAPGLIFGYEEALGYCIDPTAVKDKDGISACLLIAELAATLRAEGRTIQDALDDLALAHGLHANRQVAFRVADPGLIAAGMRRLRSDPPTQLGDLPVTSIDDLEKGSPELPPTDGLRFNLPAGRVIVRPSGTEPKLKCYLELVTPVDSAIGLPAARRQADRQLDAMASDLTAALGF